MAYHPEMMLSGRRINDGMGAEVAERVSKLMTRSRIQVVDSHVLIMGLAFKENCPAIRNTRVVDLVREFSDFHVSVHVGDPWADPEQVRAEYGIELVQNPQPGHSCVICPHPLKIVIENDGGSGCFNHGRGGSWDHGRAGCGV